MGAQVTKMTVENHTSYRLNLKTFNSDDNDIQVASHLYGEFAAASAPWPILPPRRRPDQATPNALLAVR